MIKCFATEILILPEGHQVFRWVVLAPLLQLYSFQGIQVKILMT